MKIQDMKRKEIRYALYRCKAGTPTESHKEVFQFYEDQLKEFGFSISDFAVEWDVDKKTYENIVFGKVVKKYLADITTPIPVEEIKKYKASRQQ